MIGVVGRRKQRLAILEQDRQTGAIAARPKPLRDMARALAEPIRGATSVKRPKLSLSRRGTRGKLTVDATRLARTDPSELKAAVEKAVQPITEPFGLKPRVRVRLGESGNSDAMTRQRINLRTPVLGHLVAATDDRARTALVWYGLMVVLLAVKVSPHTVNSLSAYRTLYDDAIGLDSERLHDAAAADRGVRRTDRVLGLHLSRVQSVATAVSRAR